MLCAKTWLKEVSHKNNSLTDDEAVVNFLYKKL
jgi:hypothetical protein